MFKVGSTNVREFQTLKKAKRLLIYESLGFVGVNCKIKDFT